MPILDDFFRPADHPLHPRVRDWQRRLAQPGVTAELELFQSQTALGSTQTEVGLQFKEHDQPQPLETFAWDDDLNTELIRLGVCAIDQDQEADRFALRLRASLRKASSEFGDGYFNAVLIGFIKSSDLMRYHEISTVVEHTYGSPPQKTKSWKDCQEMISNAIGVRAQELVRDLHYEEQPAKSILVAAIAKYVDQRFSISTRRQMGLL